MDVVGNDLYDISGQATWGAANRLYKQYPGKPYAFPEWGALGHRRSRLRPPHAALGGQPRPGCLAWYNGPAGSLWDLGSKPASRKAYRRHITPLGD